MREEAPLLCPKCKYARVIRFKERDWSWPRNAKPAIRKQPNTAGNKKRRKPLNITVSVHKEVFSYERLVATSVMEAAAFSLSAVDHGLDDSAIASISFMVARSTSPTPVK